MKVIRLLMFLCVFYQQNLAFLSSVYIKNNSTLKRPRRSTAAGLGKDALRKMLLKYGMFS